MERGRHAWGVGAIALAVACLSPRGWAAEVKVDITSAGRPVSEAVVSLHAATGTTTRTATARMEQQHSTFVPGVLPVQVGTTVTFPNRDNIQHHVYSFSQPKQFEIPLYSGNGAAPLRFDKPGVVVVGCNIHDWMIGHIVVLDTPYFAKTPASGNVRLDVPPGTYTLRVWHARGSGAPVTRSLTVPATGTATAVQIPLEPAKEEPRGSDRLRALQEKFRKAERSP